ncbi:hypothetical protein MJN54_36330, partial [Salmonella enterica subsp. enterica serovar Kentucky]|nr:hypothetical protein [Salmonella enterica subsp. enterica serovar Kentucky]
IVNSVFINGAMKGGGVGAEELCCQDAAKMDLLSVKPLLYRKVSQALAGFFPGWMLTQIGYIPNVVQSAGTVEGLRQLIFIYP